MSASNLVDCSRCRRHYFLSEGECPFCSRTTIMEPGRVARFAMAAMTPMVLGACYGSPKDSSDTAFGPPPSTVGNLSGTAGVSIAELGCDVVWDISGPQCDGCDLGWDASLSVLPEPETTCGFGDDTSGVFEVVAGAAYFQGDYWGAATAAGGTVEWNTVGYVYGAGGYSYSYSGAASY